MRNDRASRARSRRTYPPALLRRESSLSPARAKVRQARRARTLAARPLEPRATVGSGDAFLAGYVAARYSGKSTEQCLAYGVACGAESTQRLGAGLIDPATVARLVSETQVDRVTVPAEVS